MKSFFKFLSEARKTTASERAHKMGLTGDGQGNWVDKSGKIVARTEQGKLVFVQRAGAKSPEQEVPQQQRAGQVSPTETSRGTETEGESTEKTGGTVTLVFGRFNPPTVGHLKLLDASKAASGDGDLRIYPSRSVDSKKNPLEPDDKVELMKTMFPDHAENIVNDNNIKTIFDALKLADQDGYSEVKIVVGSDRVSEFDSLAQKYNGDIYTFDNIETISAGDRDADSEGVSGMSASKMRKAASENDFDTFRTGIPDNVSDEDAKNIMNTVRKAMKLTNENWSLWQIAPKFDMWNLRENYINRKIFRIGDIVENLNTGLVGEIIRRGTNHLICVTEDGLMFKSWIRDVMESEVPSKNLKKLAKKATNRVDANIDGFVDSEDGKKKVGPYGAFLPQARNVPKYFKMKEMTEVSGVPANQREVGTDELLQYTMKMTGTKSIKNFINKYKANK